MESTHQPIKNRRAKNPKSIPIHCTFSNVPPPQEDGKPHKKSLYFRLCDYAGHKGVSEQEIIRHLVANGLERVGY